MVYSNGRHLQSEVMDDPTLDGEQHRAALRGLARINRISGSARVLWSSIRSDALANGSRPLRVLDLACGGGDVLVSLSRLAERDGIGVDLHGCDISPTALDHAGAMSRLAGRSINFFQLDVVRQSLPAGFDVVITHLFLHHLDQVSAIEVLNKMDQCAQRGLVDDLERRSMGLIAAQVGTRLLSRSAVVHVDGSRSVRAAFTCDELQEMALHAGLSDATIRRRFPFRMLLEWRSR